MGTITARKRKDGPTGYTAPIRAQREGKLHRESATSDRKALAQEWMRRKEAELDQRRARGEPLGHRETPGKLIDWHIGQNGDDVAWGRTKAADLNVSRAAPWPSCARRRSPQQTAFGAETRKAEGAEPATEEQPRSGTEAFPWNLFERGYSIQQAAPFSLHESWEALKRHTRLRSENMPERPAPSSTLKIPVHETPAFRSM